LSEVLGHRVQFTYTAWDRIVLNGYLERLQAPKHIVYFFRHVVGVPSVTPAVLASRTAPYRALMTAYTAREGSPLLAAPKGARKADVGRPHDERLRRRGAAEGIACVLCSLETSRTFVSSAPRYPPPAGDPGYRPVRSARKRFLHYYAYVLDPVSEGPHHCLRRHPGGYEDRPPSPGIHRGRIVVVEWCERRGLYVPGRVLNTPR
jgi:hypothetical protein